MASRYQGADDLLQAQKHTDLIDCIVMVEVAAIRLKERLIPCPADDDSLEGFLMQARLEPIGSDQRVLVLGTNKAALLIEKSILPNRASVDSMTLAQSSALATSCRARSSRAGANRRVSRHDAGAFGHEQGHLCGSLAAGRAGSQLCR
jgi:hypothetical protein